MKGEGRHRIAEKLRRRSIISAVMTSCLLVGAGCTDLGADRSALDRQEGFACSAPGVPVYAAWGPRGLSKSCVTSDGTNVGSFLAAEQGRVVIRGRYVAGRRRGIWEWSDHSGQVQKREQLGDAEAE